MTEFLLAAALVLFATMSAGLLRAFRGPTPSDRMMAVQLIGSSGIGVLLLLGPAINVPALVDVALVFALLAAVAIAAFTRRAEGAGDAMTLLDALSAVLISLGLFFFIAGTVGLLRLPDPLSRLHALTKADNLGLSLLILGLLPLAGDLLAGLKLGLVWVLVLAAGATAAHLIAKRTLRGDGEDTR